MSAIAKFDRIVAKEMARYGFDLTLVRDLANISQYNPATGELVSQTESTQCRGMLFDLNLWSNGDKTEANTLIRAGDKQLLLLPKTKDNKNFSFSINDIKVERDSVIINNIKWQIISYKEINPSSQDSCLWTLYIRK